MAPGYKIGARFDWADGHKPLVQPRIVRSVSKPTLALVDTYKELSVPDLADAVGQLYVLNSDLRPLYTPMRKLVGTALTVKLNPGDNNAIKKAMLMAREGDVLVVDARGYTDTCAGGAGALVPAIRRGLAGVLVDGAWRDIHELQTLDLPIVGKAISPYSGPKRRLGEINVPVSCGGVVVEPGDIIVCDYEGGIVVPQRHAAEVSGAIQPYREPKGIDDWDIERSQQHDQAHDDWFEGYFHANGGEYLE